MRRFAWIVTLPIIAIVALFAVDNRQTIELNLWPLPWPAPAVPLYLLTLLLILVGFAIGILVMWLSGAKQRRQLRIAKRELDEAKMELHALRRQPPLAARSTGTSLATTQSRLPAA